jgi:hypothetical protein
MPMYYFHLYDDVPLRDEDGTELIDMRVHDHEGTELFSLVMSDFRR